MTPSRPISRRHLVGGAVAGVAGGGLLGVVASSMLPSVLRPDTPVESPVFGEETVPFHGAHQAGVTVRPQAHVAYLALTLRPEVDREALRRMMRLLSDDAARLMAGAPALADTEPELALLPSRLTITFGFGEELVARAAGAAPAWLRPLPAFRIDRLEEHYSGGDLLIEAASDDPTSLAHATRMLVKDARHFATLAWQQRGFRRAENAESPGSTMRNLFGQLDGTANPVPGTPDFDRLVWVGEGWLAGGTGFVLRRIRMDLDTWDEIDRADRERSVGRTLDTGAPLTGGAEHDEIDFEAKNALGLPIVPVFAHARRARTGDPRQRIYRKAYNYDGEAPGASGSDAGLLFASYQADVMAQFVPIQARLAELDMLNQWTTPIGSTVVAIPPGCEEGGFVGETLLGPVRGS